MSDADPYVGKLIDDAARRVLDSFQVVEGERPRADDLIAERRDEIAGRVAPEARAYAEAVAAQTTATPTGFLDIAFLVFVLLTVVSFLLAIGSFLRGLTGWTLALALGPMGPYASAATYLGVAALLMVASGLLLDDPIAEEKATAARSVLEAAVEAEIRSVASQSLNEVRRAVAPPPQRLLLSTNAAPRLVELSVVDAITSDTTEQVQRFITSHDSSAIGISGPRGVGKTTVMRQLCAMNPEHYIGVYIAAPVSYTTNEFVRLIRGEVARAVLTSRGEPLERRSRRLRTRLVRTVAGLSIATFGMTVVLWGRYGADAPLRPTDAAGAIAIGAGLALYVLGMRPTLPRRDRSAAEPGQLCRDELHRLAWSTRTQTVSKNEFTWRILKTSDEDSVELSEREPSHAEQVAAFRSFVVQLTKMTGKSLVIAIDELDKLDDPTDALGIVNGLKDLMHAAGVHIVVSVSEDALVSFSLRGVPVRDALDSSFDLIVPAARFTPDHAIDLMASRVIEFPDPLTLFCHAVSGGIPRDLIRHARHCIDVRRRLGEPVPIPVVVATVAREHATVLLDAMTARARTDGGPVTAYLETRRRVDEAAVDEVAGVLRACAGELRNATAGDAVARGVAVVLDVIGVSAARFGDDRTAAEWEEDIATGSAKRGAAALAAVVAEVALDAEHALSRLRQLGDVVPDAIDLDDVDRRAQHESSGAAHRNNAK